jgi:diguanylate cyclase (GGDEF)-like protein
MYLGNDHKLRAILDAISDAIIVIDTNFSVVYYNQTSLDLFVDNDTLGSDHLSDIMLWFTVTYLDGTPLPLDELPSTRVLRGEQNVPDMIMRIRRRDSQVVIVRYRVAPLYDDTGDLSGVVAILRDITEEYYQSRNSHLISVITNACAREVEETRVAQVALDKLKESLPMFRSFILIPDPIREGHASLIAASGSTVEKIPQAFCELLQSQPVTSHSEIPQLQVLATGIPLIHDSTPLAPIVDPIFEHPPESRSVVPLKFRDHLIGILSTSYWGGQNDPREYLPGELLLTIADEVATAMHRARLYEQAYQLAMRDPLTDTLNHRALQSTLQQELSARRESHQPVSLLIVDIDHFGALNETYSHDEGDLALKAIAKVIKRTVKGHGHVGRLGGDEFAIILPDVDREQAQELAEEIRVAVAEHTFSSPILPQALCMTVSIGHATAPRHASMSASLLQAAELALHVAKRSGRNTVIGYSLDMLDLLAFASTSSDRAVQAKGQLKLPSGADLDAVQALITAIDLRDGYTASHSDRVSQYAVSTAREMRLPAEQIELLRLGGMVHDVGKIGIPDSVLCKPGKLDADEWRIMQTHTTMGEEILRPVERLHSLLPLVRWHHERLDGSGYPDGLRGDEIPLLVRILSIADVFEAYTAMRPYHPGRGTEEGLAFLRSECEAGRLDHDIFAIFLQMIQYGYSTPEQANTELMNNHHAA